MTSLFVLWGLACSWTGTGAVTAGQTLEIPLGPYRFLLRASRDTATPGWTAVLLERTDSLGARDFLAVATPPFRSRNPRDVHLGHGWRAEEVLADRTRELHFVLDTAGYHRARALLELVLWPGNHAPEEVAAAHQAFQELPMGTLWLVITDGVVDSLPDGRRVIGRIAVAVTACMPGETR